MPRQSAAVFHGARCCCCRSCRCERGSAVRLSCWNSEWTGSLEFSPCSFDFCIDAPLSLYRLPSHFYLFLFYLFLLSPASLCVNAESSLAASCLTHFSAPIGSAKVRWGCAVLALLDSLSVPSGPALISCFPHTCSRASLFPTCLWQRLKRARISKVHPRLELRSRNRTSGWNFFGWFAVQSRRVLSSILGIERSHLTELRGLRRQRWGFFAEGNFFACCAVCFGWLSCVGIGCFAGWSFFFLVPSAAAVLPSNRKARWTFVETTSPLRGRDLPLCFKKK
eukprot:RCo034723